MRTHETEQQLSQLAEHHSEADMTAAAYRIESANPMTGPLLPISGFTEYLVRDVGMAVVMASKSVTFPFGQEIRVVHVPTGEIVFRKSTVSMAAFSEE